MKNLAVREVTKEEIWQERLAPGNQPIVKKRLAFPSLDLDNKANLNHAINLGGRIVVCIAFIWFGLTAQGSVNGPGMYKYTGELALVFYRWQLGTLIAGIGMLVGYDTFKKYFP